MERINLDMYFWINEEEYPGKLTENQIMEITEGDYRFIMHSIVIEMYNLDFCEVDWYPDYIKVYFRNSSFSDNEQLPIEFGFDVDVRRHRMDEETISELKDKGYDGSIIPYNGEKCLLACSLIDGKIRYSENNRFKYLNDDELYRFLFTKTALCLYEYIVKDVLYHSGSSIYREWMNKRWQIISPKMFAILVKTLPIDLDVKKEYKYACDRVSLFWKYNEELFNMDTDVVKAYINETKDITSSLFIAYGIGVGMLDNFNHDYSEFLCVITQKQRDLATGVVTAKRVIERIGFYTEFIDDISDTFICDDKTWYTMDCYQKCDNCNKLVATYIIGNDHKIWNVIFHPDILEIKHSKFYYLEELDLYDPDMGLLNLPLSLKVGDIITIDCRPFHNLHHAVVVKSDNDKCEYMCLHYTEKGLELKALNDFYHGAEELSPLARLDYYLGELDDRERLIGDVSEAVKSDKNIASDIISIFEEIEIVSVEERIISLIK